jgi:hypothetical protein
MVSLITSIEVGLPWPFTGYDCDSTTRWRVVVMNRGWNGSAMCVDVLRYAMLLAGGYLADSVRKALPISPEPSTQGPPNTSSLSAAKQRWADPGEAAAGGTGSRGRRLSAGVE